ncbi:MAG: redoxin domain-containing protein [Bacteroidia bacterium]
MSKCLSLFFLGFLIGLSIYSRPLLAQERVNISGLSLENAQGEKISFDTLTGKKLTVVVFTSSHCSWALQYQERLSGLFKRYQDKGVKFIAINSNDPSMSARDSASRMQSISAFPFPYLKDADQQIARFFHATKNPEALVLIPAEKQFEIAFRGQIDDNPLDTEMVKVPYLSNAIDSLLAGKKPAVVKGELSGCDIKWIE